MPTPDDKLQLSRVMAPTELPVFSIDLQGLPGQLQLARQALDDLRRQYPEPPVSNVRAVYMSPWKSHRLHPGLLPLCQAVTVIAESCAKATGGFHLADLNLRLAITDCWGAIYEAADTTLRHNHFPAEFAAVVYLEAEDGCAPIVFGGRMAVQPRPGSLLVFPGILDHEVPPTAGRRVVIAMNLHKVSAFVPPAGAAASGGEEQAGIAALA
jgi:hypothetical protein